MEPEKKYSSEGRVLRPRRKGPSAGDAGREGGHRSFENRNYDEHRSGYRREGGYRSQEGGYRREGGYRSNQEGGYRREGGYRSQEGGYRSQEGGYRREGGYRQDGGRRQEGGYRREGGYRSQDGSGRSNFRGQSSQRGGYRQGGNRPGGPRKGGPKSYGRRPVQFTDRDEEGINRMISRKAESDARAYEGRQVPDTFQEEIRLNKFIANSGVCSRREADTLIQAGVVTVNGEV
ncbi:MAG: pseudouridine synthase, partial [Bacteroidales bacterium]|nr:pseudouridine synthase [Bacteroidales bacterium]